MKVLVTGGAGYIGSVVAKKALDRGFKVIVFDNLSRGYKELIPDEVEFYKGDLLREDSIREVCRERIDAVFHLAASCEVGESQKEPVKYYLNNVVGTLNLLQAMLRFGVKKMIFSSTAAVYGEPEKIPIYENHPTNPVNVYGYTKLVCEKMMEHFCSAYGLKAISLRYFNAAGACYGLGELHNPETHLIPRLLKLALGEIEKVEIFGADYPTRDGTPIRDYIHVEDIAEAHLLALDRIEKVELGVFNLGNGEGFSVKEVVEVVEKVTKKPLPVKVGERRPGDPAVLIADSTRIREALGWAPKRRDLEDIIQSAWEFYLSRN
jgi:UDP-glucose 4-epimerase